MQGTAEAHHSANYDQAFPCRHSSTGNGKSLFSHTPMEAMGHGAMQMRCVYTHARAHTHRRDSRTVHTHRDRHEFLHKYQSHIFSRDALEHYDNTITEVCTSFTEMERFISNSHEVKFKKKK